MNGTDFDRTLIAWLDEAAPRRGPDALVAVTEAAVKRERPKPLWLALLTERPMRRAGRVVAGSASARAVYLAAVALLVVAAAAAAIATGARLLPSRPLPPPFGPAANGLIAYDTNAAIYAAEPDGQPPRVGDGDLTGAASPTFSPDGTRVAFWADSADKKAVDLYVISADGSGRVAVARNLWAASDKPLVWSPDGRRLVFAAETGILRDDERLFIANADGSGLVELGPNDTRDPARRLLPSWSPDGRWISFQEIRPSMQAAQSELWVIRPDGSDRLRIATVGRFFWRPGPQWEPTTTGARLVYAGDEFTMNGGIFLLDMDRRSRTVVSAGNGVEAGPSWSPDGRRIAWFATAFDGRTWDVQPTLSSDVLGIANPDGSAAVTIGADGIAGQPAWSPDGTRILGSSADRRSVIILAVDGSVPPIVIAHATGQGMPTWQRVAP
jgi:Tol biopolymer transport system component